MNLYHVYRADRVSKTKMKGGGVRLAIRYCITVIPFCIDQVTDCFDDIDALCVNIISSGGRSTTLVLVYITPDIKSDLFDQFFEQLTVFLTHHQRHLMVIGDFNLSGYFSRYCERSKDVKTNITINWPANFNLEQYNSIFNKYDKCLDLVFANFSCSVMESESSLVKVDSHHPALLVSLLINDILRTNHLSSNHGKLNFKKLDKVAICEALNAIDWQPALLLDDVDKSCNEFYSKVNSTFFRFCPSL